MRFVLKTFHRRSHGYFIFLWASSDVNDVFSPHLPLAPLPLIVSFALLDIEDARIMATSNFKFQISNTKKKHWTPLDSRAHHTHKTEFYFTLWNQGAENCWKKILLSSWCYDFLRESLVISKSVIVEHFRYTSTPVPLAISPSTRYQRKGLRPAVSPLPLRTLYKCKKTATLYGREQCFIAHKR